MWGNPPGKIIMHTCDNKKCVNPNHLRLGTVKDNSEDMVKKRRHAYGERNPQAILTNIQVKTIWELLNNGVRVSSIAKRFAIKRNHVYDIKTRSWQLVKGEN